MISKNRGPVGSRPVHGMLPFGILICDIVGDAGQRRTACGGGVAGMQRQGVVLRLPTASGAARGGQPGRGAGGGGQVRGTLRLSHTMGIWT